MKKDMWWWWWWGLYTECFVLQIHSLCWVSHILHPLCSVGLLGYTLHVDISSLCFFLTYAFLLSYILLHFIFCLYHLFLSAEANSKCIVVEPHCYTFSTIKYPEKQKLTCLPSKNAIDEHYTFAYNCKHAKKLLLSTKKRPMVPL